MAIKKTTCRFSKNNGSFYQKQRVVLSKTTARFSANNVLFFANKVLIRQPTDYQNKKNLGHREMSKKYDATYGDNCCITVWWERNVNEEGKPKCALIF